MIFKSIKFAIFLAIDHQHLLDIVISCHVLTWWWWVASKLKIHFVFELKFNVSTNSFWVESGDNELRVTLIMTHDSHGHSWTSSGLNVSPFRFEDNFVEFSLVQLGSAAFPAHHQLWRLSNMQVEQCAWTIQILFLCPRGIQRVHIVTLICLILKQKLNSMKLITMKIV